jgi:cell wall-associated NlpC family hydrolase
VTVKGLHAAVAAAVAVATAGLVTGCGVAGHGSTEAGRGAGHTVSSDATLRAHPQAIDPVAGQAAPVDPGPGAAPAQPSVVSVGPSSTTGGRLPQPVSDAEVRAELAASGLSANPDQATLTPGRLAIPPVNAPAAVQAVINAGNEIAQLPYVWGGGHARYEDTGYDCSGSLSFVLAAAGLLNGTETSGELMRYGDAGPGRWITIFANPGHTFAYIAGLRFDTVALAETGSRWSNRSANEPDLKAFAVRHPPGL